MVIFLQRLRRRLLKGGINKLMRPKQYGGTFIGVRPFTKIVRKVASHSVAAAWLTKFYAVHDIWPGYLPPKGREEVLGSHEFDCGCFCSTWTCGKGWRWISSLWVNGTLPAVSYGVNMIGLGAMADLGNGPEYVMAVVSTSDPDLKLIENWDTFGLRSTGSNGVHVDGAYIPEHLILRGKDIFDLGKPMGGDYDPEDPVYRMPFMQLFLVGFPATLIRCNGTFNSDFPRTYRKTCSGI